MESSPPQQDAVVETQIFESQIFETLQPLGKNSTTELFFQWLSLFVVSALHLLPI